MRVPSQQEINGQREAADPDRSDVGHAQGAGAWAFRGILGVRAEQSPPFHNHHATESEPENDEQGDANLDDDHEVAMGVSGRLEGMQEELLGNCFWGEGR